MDRDKGKSEIASDPRAYDYSSPILNCDIVMEGGITSGIVYPWAVCELARTYRLKNIGGTSAGAIAAAIAAAAELGRSSVSGGFRRLANFPLYLSKGTNLFDLFQPDRRTRRLFEVLTAGIGHNKPLQRFLVTAARRYASWLGMGMLPGGILLLTTFLGGHVILLSWAVLSAILLMSCGALAGVCLGILRSAVRELPINMFGLCSGIGSATPKGTPPLTVWLSSELNRLAGKPEDAVAPLTFGDLWKAEETRGAELAGEKHINLEMITTNITHSRPYRLPFDSALWFFDPSEFRRLFPENVVRWMENHPPVPPSEPSERRWWELLCRLLDPLRPLPSARDLPIIVATRLSLSFPLLISAVPLWTIDWSRKRNQEAARAWRGWLRDLGDGWSRIRDNSEAWTTVPKPTQPIVPGRCWFSDGGIASNFPVHFFDAPLPRWPTFAINLRPFHPDFTKQADEARNVSMPESNLGGISEWWASINVKPGIGSLGQFILAIIDTMRNWADSTQSRIPGYRDRIAHVHLAPDEGGINLRMPTERILALSERGRGAGQLLAQRFGPHPPPGTVLTWDNHRWVRYRTTMALIERVVSMFGRAISWPVPAESRTYAQLIERDEKIAPSSYRWKGQRQQAYALQATKALISLYEAWSVFGETFGEGAPKPTPELRVRPSL